MGNTAANRPRLPLWLVGFVIAPLMGGMLLLTLLLTAMSTSPASTDVTDKYKCLVVTGPDGTPRELDYRQVQTAGNILIAAREISAPERAQIIALATALTESDLRNLANPNVAGSLDQPNDGVGTDHDSVGVFQQRAGWGSVPDRMNIAWATKAFLGGPSSPEGTPSGLLDIPGWESMTLTEAAQAVQVSAYPDAYAKHTAAAEGLYAALGDNPQDVAGCEQLAAALPAGDLVAAAVAMSYPNSAASRVDGDLWGASKALPAYKAAKEAAMQISTKPEGAPGLYASCDRFVATVAILFQDPDVPWGNVPMQYDYLDASPKWQRYTDLNQAQPGDIWVTRNVHIMTFLGEVPGYGRAVAHASYMDRLPALASANIIDHATNADTWEGNYYVGFRYVGGGSS